jgi:hypothetical protein
MVMTTGTTDYRGNPSSSGNPGMGSEAGGVRDAARSSYETAKQEAAGLGEELKNQGAELVGAARARAQGLAEEQVAFGADQIDGIARAATKAADELEQASPQLARYVRDAASAADNFSTSLRERSVGDIFQSISDFARREPVIFFGLTVAAGFALSRFLKSSSSYSHDPYRMTGSDYRSPYGGSSYGGSSYGGQGSGMSGSGASGGYGGSGYAGHDADIGQSRTPVASTHATPAEFPTGKTTTTDPMSSSSGSVDSSGTTSSTMTPGRSGTSMGTTGGTSPSMMDNKPSSGATAVGATASPTRTTFPSGTPSGSSSSGTGTSSSTTSGGSNT